MGRRIRSPHLWRDLDRPSRPSRPREHAGRHRARREDYPIVRGCEDIWVPTDVYGVRLPLPGDCRPLVLGQVLSGMNPNDKPVAGPKNNPLMPVAWTKTYRGSRGTIGRVFTTTMGARQGFPERGPAAAAGQCRLLVRGARGEDSRPGQRRFRRPLSALGFQRLRRLQTRRPARGPRDGQIGRFPISNLKSEIPSQPPAMSPIYWMRGNNRCSRHEIHSV